MNNLSVFSFGYVRDKGFSVLLGQYLQLGSLHLDSIQLLHLGQKYVLKSS